MNKEIKMWGFWKFWRESIRFYKLFDTTNPFLVYPAYKRYKIEFNKDIELKAGDKVKKEKGYKFDATVVAVFQTTAGKARVVAENGEGLLHIFNEKQLSKV